MKKIIKASALTAVFAFALTFSIMSSTTRVSNLTRENISMLSASADVEVSELGGNLTGPRENIDCAKIGTGSREVCRCENQNFCTDGTCF